MSSEFFEALSLIEKQNGVPATELVEKIAAGVKKALEKEHPGSNIAVLIDIERQTVECVIIKEVVEGEPEDPAKQISLAKAKNIDRTAVVGGTCHIQLDATVINRATMINTKQNIINDIKTLSMQKLINRFGNKENECISCVVKEVEPTRGSVTLVYDHTELYLSRSEQIPGERFREGENVKVYIVPIDKEKKPVIRISRTHPQFVARLFELEVPEISQGTVRIVSVSREAGSRTKLAVCSNDPNVDAIGACIGPRRTRINAIVNELNGEKIDLIQYYEEPERFIARALSPAEVISVTIDEENPNECTVIVPNNQLSLAIGNKGQNAKLAARLTRFKINILPEFENYIKGVSDEEENSES